MNSLELEKNLNIKDLTQDPNHCVYQIVQKLKISLEKKYGPAQVERGNKVVSLEDNYYALGYSISEATMSKRYTRYIDENNILRTQMTSVIPSVLKTYSLNSKESQLWICPGMVYRRDVVDKTHVGEPHQMDVWYLRKNWQPQREDLIDLVQIIIDEISVILKTSLKWRYNETSHHYTDNGIEVEILYQGKWLEILECGIAGRKLLDQHNLSSYSGLALGMGLDRLAMIIKQLEDIRLLKDLDPRIQQQMTTLDKYQEVSKQPPIKRDLSLAVEKDLILEELTEEVMLLLKDKAHWVEEIKLVSDTAYEDLPEVARKRLGIKPKQKNWLIRITLRHLSRSISVQEGNEIYSLLYESLHKGDGGYLIK